ncbi:HAD superfamily hydrolase (TIGR01509 family)/HAD superfamily hydrolase (TIGR01549 family) [Rhodococcus sp. SMB37]|uniref:HAD family hydrolase n=1 Tax=Rhodococcus sp. SMB37 TaxID=2512213 RepID=UPI0006D1FDE2|nr:HAD family hydrolase [Rhodococcus sp. SMB37]TCN58131.1 HAD superfamily hydrolase (TIGR01509 family)/HAD superfamily hydrolase (TIGR01549 family) [Rhodococcus sp. SMB37]
MGTTSFDAVLFDFSGTLFRLEEDDSWMEQITDNAGAQFDVHQQAELMRRLTAPTGQPVEMDAEEHHAWTNRDRDPAWHREAYLTVLRKSGVADPQQAQNLYAKVTDPACWTVYPDTVPVIEALSGEGYRIGVLSNIAFDIRPAFAVLGVDDLVSAFTLSFEVGAVKPEPEIFRYAVETLGVDPTRTLMIGDSEKADGAARKIGCSFELVEPRPTAERPDALWRALSAAGIRPSEPGAGKSS